MHLFFYLPEPAELGVVFKLLALIVALMSLHWLFTVIFINTVYANSEFPRELDIWRAQQLALIWTLALFHLYILALLNWNLGVFGAQSLRDPHFFLRFHPELLLTVALVTLAITKKHHILQAVKIEA